MSKFHGHLPGLLLKSPFFPYGFYRLGMFRAPLAILRPPGAPRPPPPPLPRGLRAAARNSAAAEAEPRKAGGFSPVRTLLGTVVCN